MAHLHYPRTPLISPLPFPSNIRVAETGDVTFFFLSRSVILAWRLSSLFCFPSTRQASLYRAGVRVRHSSRGTLKYEYFPGGDQRRSFYKVPRSLAGRSIFHYWRPASWTRSRYLLACWQLHKDTLYTGPTEASRTNPPPDLGSRQPSHRYPSFVSFSATPAENPILLSPLHTLFFLPSGLPVL